MVVMGGNARYTHFREQTGIEVDYGCRSEITRSFSYNGRAMSCYDSFTTKLIARECEVLAQTDDGEPVFTKFKYGKGTVIVVNSPIDTGAIGRTDCFTGANPTPFYQFYRTAAQVAGVKTVVEKGENPYVCFTEHPAKDGSTIVVGINFEPRAQKCPVKINGTLGRVWRGDVKVDAVTLAPNEAAVFEVK